MPQLNRSAVVACSIATVLALSACGPRDREAPDSPATAGQTKTATVTTRKIDSPTLQAIKRRGRLNCGAATNEDDVTSQRFRGVRIFDISDLNAPRQIAAVQTCRGSHTHTLVPHPTDANVLYIYNSGTSDVRGAAELAICTDGQPDQNPETALFSIDVI